MDSAIGLSLLLAEIVEPPFGGCFITFSGSPHIQMVGGPNDTRTFKEKIQYMEGSDWGMNTDFVAVFEKLILPLAIKHQLKQEDMVKQVFVFSDMEFDAAGNDAPRWSTSYERIKAKFEEAGYEMPKLIFWNLAYGRGYSYSGWGDDEERPKPVQADEPGTALVSGYSQAQMKMFLDGGNFDELEVEDEVEDEVVKLEGEDDDEGADEFVDVRIAKKQKMDPLLVVKKAISHPAYQMLKVVD
jgi:hypothetical protein